jgi:predicted membrane channel-forming protein YqfA (hemolysin III family)
MNAKKKADLNNLIFYVSITLASLASIAFIINSGSPLFATFIVGFIWVVGYLFYKKRKGIMDWSDSYQPLGDYVKEKQKVPEAPKRSYSVGANALDSANLTPLTDREEEQWNHLVTGFQEAGFDQQKPKKERKKKKD